VAWTSDAIMNALTDEAAALGWLLSPDAVRERARAMLALGLEGRLQHFDVDLARLDAAASVVADVMGANYPDGRVPYHSRWRHFAAGGLDRWAELRDRLPDDEERIRARIDLAVVSVLLDAGAGADWRFQDRSDNLLARSEGLAVASLEAFASGLFSSDSDRPLRADAAALTALTSEQIGHAFQVREGNPLLGLEGRTALMQNLGAALQARPDLFGTDPARPGNMLDRLAGDTVSVPAVLRIILDGFGPIWPGRQSLGGHNLGDVWRHPAFANDDLTSEFVPFHKLSQWMTYSLAEIFEEGGKRLVGLDRLTGLPEYRNGGLFLDTGVLRLRDSALAKLLLPVDHLAVVEWRALTVALLDLVAERVRALTGRPDLPLAAVLEGGTWAAGRKLAAERREGGGPPLTIVSDGTVF
jgi:hypothetical protein